MNNTKLPFVLSVVVPVLNEERYIRPCLGSLLGEAALRADGTQFEILVMDGGSTDRTCEIVAEMQASHRSIRLAHNPKRLQSAALDIGSSHVSPHAQPCCCGQMHMRHTQTTISPHVLPLLCGPA